MQLILSSPTSAAMGKKQMNANQYAKVVLNINNVFGILLKRWLEVSWDSVGARRLIRQSHGVFGLIQIILPPWLYFFCISPRLPPRRTKTNPAHPQQQQTQIVLSDSIGTAASAGLCSYLQDDNMICAYWWVKQLCYMPHNRRDWWNTVRLKGGVNKRNGRTQLFIMAYSHSCDFQYTHSYIVMCVQRG